MTTTEKILKQLNKRIDKLELSITNEKNERINMKNNLMNEINQLNDLEKQTMIKMGNQKNKIEHIIYQIQINQKQIELLILNIENINSNIKLQGDFYADIEKTEENLILDDTQQNEIEELTTQLYNDFQIKLDDITNKINNKEESYNSIFNNYETSITSIGDNIIVLDSSLENISNSQKKLAEDIYDKIHENYNAICCQKAETFDDDNRIQWDTSHLSNPLFFEKCNDDTEIKIKKSGVYIIQSKIYSEEGATINPQLEFNKNKKISFQASGNSFNQGSILFPGYLEENSKISVVLDDEQKEIKSEEDSHILVIFKLF